MTDKQVEEINRLVKECKHRHNFGVCNLQVSPCNRVIDTGRCPIICEYLSELEVQDGKDTN